MKAIRGGMIFTPREKIEEGVILIDKGKIVEVGQGVAVPKDAEVIDASGKFILPGMIDAHCHTGVFADGVGWEESDGNEMTDPITPHLRAIDAIHPDDIAFKDLRDAGIIINNIRRIYEQNPNIVFLLRRQFYFKQFVHILILWKITCFSRNATYTENIPCNQNFSNS